MSGSARGRFEDDKVWFAVLADAVPTSDLHAIELEVAVLSVDVEYGSSSSRHRQVFAEASCLDERRTAADSARAAGTARGPMAPRGGQRVGRSDPRRAPEHGLVSTTTTIARLREERLGARRRSSRWFGDRRRRPLAWAILSRIKPSIQPARPADHIVAKDRQTPEVAAPEASLVARAVPAPRQGSRARATNSALRQPPRLSNDAASCRRDRARRGRP